MRGGEGMEVEKKPTAPLDKSGSGWKKSYKKILQGWKNGVYVNSDLRKISPQLSQRWEV